MPRDGGGWLLRAELSNGTITELDVSDRVPQPTEPDLLGAADADGDGRDEVFANLDHGASVAFLGVFAVVDSRLVTVTEPSKPLTIPVWGSVTHGNGVECRPKQGELVLLSITTSDQRAHFDWERTVYRWKGKSVRRASTRRGTLTPSGDDDNRLDPYWRFRCGVLDLAG